jgi:protein FAM50
MSLQSTLSDNQTNPLDDFDAGKESNSDLTTNNDLDFDLPTKRQKKNSKKTAALSFDQEDDPSTMLRLLSSNNETNIGSVVDNTTQDGNDSLVFLNTSSTAKRVFKLLQKIDADWYAEQERIKSEPLTVVFSWWDGSGHRMEVQITKGDTILTFLTRAKEIILKNGFQKLSRTLPSQLLYIKEDLIIPHDATFYDFIATDARGKSGSLVYFGVKDDIRLAGNAQQERDDAHAGKIMEESFYKTNQHIHPYNRFEKYDPKKKYDVYTQ